MSVSITLEAQPSLSLSFAVSPRAELAAFLHAMRGRDPHPRFPSELADIITTVTPQLGYGLIRFSPLWSSYYSRLFYPAARPSSKFDSTLETSIACVRDIPTEALMNYLIWSCLDGYRAPRITPDLNDSRQMSEFARAAHKLSPLQGALADEIVAGGEWLCEEIIGVLEQFTDEVFHKQWDAVSTNLRSDAMSRQRLLESGAPSPFEGLPGFTFDDSRRNLTINKSMSRRIKLGHRELICIPSYFGLPHVRVKDEPGHPVIVHYPIAPGTQADARATQERLRVLSAPQRLEICRLLAREALSTSELAARIGVSAPQAARLLRALRNARLLRSERLGKYVYYELDIDAVARSGAEFAKSLLT